MHYAADLEHPNYKLDREMLEGQGITLHQIPIVKSPFRFVQNGKALREILKIIRREGIQAVHCHTPAGGLIGRLAGMLCGRKLKVIYTAHGFHFYRGAPQPGAFIYRTVEKVLARFTDILIVINREDYQSALKFRLRGALEKDGEGGQVYRIPGVGLDMENFAPLTEEERVAGRRKLGLEEEERAAGRRKLDLAEEECAVGRRKLGLKEEERAVGRRKLGLAEDALFLVSVGELNENKNHRSVLLALDQMRRAGKDISRIRYGICGDGILREKLAGEIETLGLSGIVKMYGYQSPVQPVLGCADAFLFPSRREGLGMAALEALSMGIPVIAADNRGTREYMEPGRNGFVCGWDDIDGYIRGIEKIQSMGQEQREEMKRYCRESVKGFEKKNTAQAMREVYRRLDEMIERNCGRRRE